jgi:ferredoxin
MSNSRPERRVAKVVVDRNLCFSHEQCVATAPEVFSLDEESISTVGDISRVDDDTLSSAAEYCPVQAIFLYDGDGNQIYPADSVSW